MELGATYMGLIKLVMLDILFCIFEDDAGT